MLCKGEAGCTRQEGRPGWQGGALSGRARQGRAQAGNRAKGEKKPTWCTDAVFGDHD